MARIGRLEVSAIGFAQASSGAAADGDAAIGSQAMSFFAGGLGDLDRYMHYGSVEQADGMIA